MRALRRTSPPRGPVAFFANGIGDHLLNLPALRALDRLFPGRLRLLCSAGLDRIFFEELAAERLALECESTAVGREFDVERAARFARGCDLFLSLNPWHSRSTGELLESLRPERSIGFFPTFTQPVPLDFSKHTSELAFDVPRALDPALAIEDFDAPPRLPESARAAARRILSDAPAGARFVAAHLDTNPTKMLPPSTWRRVFERFLAEHPGWYVLSLGTRPQPIEGEIGSERVVRCQGLALAVSLALVAECQLFVGVDSSLLHAADAFRVPGVGAFVSTDPHEFGFRAAPHRHVRADATDEAAVERELLRAIDELLDGLPAAEGGAR